MQGNYTMLADVFVPIESQDAFNKVTQEWILDSTVECELKSVSVNSEMRFSLQTFDDFFILPSIVYGRFSRDIRIAKNGNLYPLTSILITNLRTRPTVDGQEERILFEEPVDGEMKPMVFEVRNIGPFIDPWGNPEYWKTQLMRTEDQKVITT